MAEMTESARRNVQLAQQHAAALDVPSQAKTHDTIAYAVACIYVQARHVAGGPTPNRYSAARTLKKWRHKLRGVVELCTTHGIDIAKYVELQCRCFKNGDCFPAMLVGPNALKRWDTHKRRLFPETAAVTAPNLDEYETGVHTLRDAAARLNRLGLSIEDIMVMTAPMLPIGYLVESPTARGLSYHGKLMPEALNADVQRAMKPRGNENLRGDGL